MAQKYFLGFHTNLIAWVKRENKKISIEHVKSLPENVKPLYILKPILHGKSHKIVTGLNSESILIRSLTLKLKSEREILKTLPFQVEGILPFDQEDLLFIPTMIPIKEGTRVSLLATSQKTVADHLKQLKSIDIEPDTISCAPVALFRFARHLYPQSPSLIAFHEQSQTLIVIENRRLVATQVLQSGDLTRSIDYIQKKYPEINELLHLGDSPIEAPFKSLPINKPKWTPYAIPIGLALDAALSDDKSVQFRHEKIQSEKHLKKSKSRLIQFALACMIFSSITLILGQSYTKKKQQHYLSAIGYEKNASLKQAVNELGQSLSQKKKGGLSLSTIPKVYEVLTWLSTHPKLAEKTSLTRLKYEMTKTPKLGTNIKSYGAKVELEFQTELPRLARSFHDSLLSDKVMVDHKQNVHFSADHGSYKASFYLKPRKL